MSTVLIFGPPASPASANEYSVSSEAEYRTALIEASASAGPHTIRFEADFQISDPGGQGDPYYYSGESLTIDGGGHTVFGDADAETMFLVGGAYSFDVTITNLTLEGFADYGTIGLGSAMGTVTLKDSTFTNNSSLWDGAVVSVYGPELIVTGCNFDHNSSDYGGAISAYSGVTIIDSNFTNNTAQTVGSAMYVEGPLEVWSSTFADNTSNLDGSGGAGGTVWSSEPTAVETSSFLRNVALSGSAIYSLAAISVTDSSFIDNSSSGDGGALTSETHVNVLDSLFSGNTAGGSGGAIWGYDRVSIATSEFNVNSANGDGGAIISKDDEVAVVSSSFSRNSAAGDGGAIWSYYPITVSSSSFIENTAARGGAVFNDDDDVFVTGSTFARNTATEGGAIWADYAVTVENSTFADNTAGTSGGAIYARADDITVNHVTFGSNAANIGSHLFVGGSGSVLARASVFSPPAGTGTGCTFASGTATSSGDNFDSDGTCTDGRVGLGDFGANIDPLLDPLGDNGGSVLTMAPSDLSPLVSGIPLTRCTVGSLDQAGTARPLGSGCEPGALEVLGEISFIIDTDAGEILVTVRGALGARDIGNVNAVHATPAPPAGLSLPYGISEFTLDVPSAGASVLVILRFPGPVGELWKLTAGSWERVDDATVDGATVTYLVTDGGPFDDDEIANSVLVDPVAGGFVAGFTG